MHYDDIVVWCQHGETQDFAQRYRWMTSQGVWVPVDTTGESNTFVGEQLPNPGMTLEEFADSPPQAQDFSARCKTCPNKVPMGYGGAQFALRRLAKMGLTRIPMAVLRHAYNEVPKQLRK